jgi:hypothetical protein
VEQVVEVMVHSQQLLVLQELQTLAAVVEAVVVTI